MSLERRNTCKCLKTEKCSKGKCVRPVNKNLKEPTLNSALRHLRCIDTLKNSDITSNKIVNVAGILEIDSMITKKLNFCPSHMVFKNLIPINVNDSILLTQKKDSLKKKNSKSTEKMPIPNLHDFLKPVEPLVYIVPEREFIIDNDDVEFDYISYYRQFMS